MRPDSRCLYRSTYIVVVLFDPELFDRPSRVDRSIDLSDDLGYVRSYTKNKKGRKRKKTKSEKGGGGFVRDAYCRFQIIVFFSKLALETNWW